LSERDAAMLLALITERQKGVTVAGTVAEVLASEDVSEVWASRHPLDLFGGDEDPHLVAARRQLDAWTRAEIQYVSILDSAYPRRLRAVHDAPPFLFYRGRLETVQSGGISVVGSRDASDEGLNRAREVARLLVSEGMPVISGLARGIDSAAHDATLQAGGTPVGVIATGIAAPYTPASSRQLHEKVAAEGALISQFTPDAHAMKHTFLQRNATMSGIGLATFVIEAGENSGARAQARLAMQHGRPVILTDVVATRTEWGRTLADGSRGNVYIASNLSEAAQAVDRVRAMTHFESLDQLLTTT